MLLFYWTLTLFQIYPIVTARRWALRNEVRPYREHRRAEPDPFRESYSPLSKSQDIYREGYQHVATVTSPVPSVTPRPNPPNFKELNATSPVATTSCTAGGLPLQNSTALSSPATLIPAISGETPSNTPAMAQSATSSNIFGTPIATSAPASHFPVRKDHPVPRKGIGGPTPIGTNKFYANFFLKQQTSPTYVHPYSVAWSHGQGSSSSWGLAISHIEAHQRVYGQKSKETGAAQYFLSPVGIQSLALSALEFGSQTMLTTDNLSAHSANVNLHVDPKAKPLVTFPLVQGMGFVTAVYKGGTPVISTGVYFKTVTKSLKGPKQGVTKYTLYLEDGKVWHVYAYSAKGDKFDLTVINNKMAKAEKPFDGIVQVAKDPGNAESIIDAASGAYPIGATVSGSVSGSKGSYTLTFQKAGFSKRQALDVRLAPPC